MQCNAGRKLLQVALVARSLRGAEDVLVHLGSLLIQEPADMTPVVSGLRVKGEVTRQQIEDDMDSVSVLLEWSCPGMLANVQHC